MAYWLIIMGKHFATQNKAICYQGYAEGFLLWRTVDYSEYQKKGEYSGKDEVYHVRYAKDVILG